jgi:predicted metal-dependent hydrolase
VLLVDFGDLVALFVSVFFGSYQEWEYCILPFVLHTLRNLLNSQNVLMDNKHIFIESIGEVTINKNRQAMRFKITIRPNGTVRVTIPWIASFQSGEKFLSEHLQWIAQTKQKLIEKQCVPKLIQPGHLFSTRNYHYHVCSADVPRFKIRYSEKEKNVLFEYPMNQSIDSNENQNILKLAIENVLRFDAKKYLPLRIAELALNLGYTYQKVTIKNNKTNWGSCSNRKNINLNLHLMRLSDKLIDYVIVHELVHTIIPNHGAGFKATMQKHFQDTAEMEMELKKIRTGIY